MSESSFFCRRDVSYVVPSETARMIADRAWEMWGNHANEGRETRHTTTIVVWQGRRGLVGQGSSPTGSFSISWDRPSHNQASITTLAWDPRQGTEESVRRAINHLAGWPVARAS